MKKLMMFISVLLCVSLFVGCGGGSLPKEVKKFMGFIDDGEYLKAIEYYNESLYGDATLEDEAEQAITDSLNKLKDDVLKGKKTEEESKKTIATIDSVLAKTTLYIDDYYKIKADIETAIASRAAFLAGEELEELKNYADAISEYNKVIEEDSNYTQAKKAIERCAETLKKIVFDKAEELAEKNEYIEAIAQLKELKKKLPQDDEVAAKVTVYEKTYINYILESAEAVFVTPSTDYVKALEIINGALQHYGDNEELLSKKDYYQSFTPVNLYDMDKLRGNADTILVDEDTYGNTHEKCFYMHHFSETDISYFLNQKYNSFTATIYGREKSNSAAHGVVEIYADNKIVYQKTNVIVNATRPFDINIDVTGVSEIRIVLKRIGGQYSDGIGMTNMLVQKTVK